jgi:pyruvate ferredoxin oxidoreductase alpha subunit
MPRIEIMDGNEAAAWGAKLSRVDVISAYPITPQTPLANHIAEFVAKGEFDAEYIRSEGEHSVIGQVTGASAAGARIFTASSSQGIAFMVENMFAAAGLRLPLVMCVVNRSLMGQGKGGLTPDHNDSLLFRDASWIQLYVENPQEVLDTVIQAFKIAEDESVCLPVSPCYDGYFVSATAIPVEIPDQEKVDSFLPPFKNKYWQLHPDKPIRNYQMASTPKDEFIRRIDAMENAKKVIEDTDIEFRKKFGRSWGGLLEEYHCENVEAVLITMGSMSSTAKDVVDDMRSEGKRVGLVKLRSFRPFPTKRIRDIGRRVPVLGFVDRNTSHGSAGGGIGCIETARALYSLDERPILLGFWCGIGGVDVIKQEFRYMFNRLLEVAHTGKPKKEYEIIQFPGKR